MDVLKRLSRADRSKLAGGGIVLAVIFFLALNVLVNASLTQARVDLTEEDVYTLSEGTRSVLADIEEPVRLRYYVSERLVQANPYYASYARRVRELLQDYVRLSEGKVRLRIFHPEPYSPEEDKAVADGLQGARMGNVQEPVYFGLAGSNMVDGTDVVPFLSPERQQFLEYDLTRLVSNLANPKKPVVAVVGDLPLQGDRANRFQPWRVLQILRQSYRVKIVGGEKARIDDEVDVVLLAQPQNLAPKTLYAVDQFALRGGRVLAFVDPHSEAMARRRRRGTPVPPSAVETLGPLLESWGVEMPADKIVADRAQAQRVRVNIEGRAQVTDYVAWLDVGEDHLAADDAVTGDLERVTFHTAGLIRAREGAETTLTPLARTSLQSMLLPVGKVQGRPNPAQLLSDFQASGGQYTLAARIDGPVASAFGEAPPESVEDEAVREAHRATSDGPAHIVLVADGDMLTDEAWTRSGSLGAQMAIPVANNGDFVANAVDNLSGNPALIALRGRGEVSRPFTVIERMRRQAEQRYRAKEQELIERIDEAEQRIRELQRSDEQSGVVMTDEQEQEVDKLRADLLRAREQLRQVRNKLREDIERLERGVKAANIAGMPLLVAVVAIALALVRRVRAARRPPAAD